MPGQPSFKRQVLDPTIVIDTKGWPKKYSIDLSNKKDAPLGSDGMRIEIFIDQKDPQDPRTKVLHRLSTMFWLERISERGIDCIEDQLGITGDLKGDAYTRCGYWYKSYKSGVYGVTYNSDTKLSYEEFVKHIKADQSNNISIVNFTVFID